MRILKKIDFKSDACRGQEGVQTSVEVIAVDMVKIARVRIIHGVDTEFLTSYYKDAQL